MSYDMADIFSLSPAKRISLFYKVSILLPYAASCYYALPCMHDDMHDLCEIACHAAVAFQHEYYSQLKHIQQTPIVSHCACSIDNTIRGPTAGADQIRSLLDTIEDSVLSMIAGQCMYDASCGQLCPQTSGVHNTRALTIHFNHAVESP
jgi:hypothetical protein